MESEQGKCANCGSNFLDYGASELEDEFMGYHYRCEDCGHEGIEWYIMEYDEST